MKYLYDFYYICCEKLNIFHKVIKNEQPFLFHF